MSEEIKTAWEFVKWLTPLAAGIVGYIVRAQRTRIKELDEKIDENEKKLIETFREGLKEERKFRMGILKKHDSKIIETCKNIGKIKEQLAGIEKDLEWIRKNENIR